MSLVVHKYQFSIEENPRIKMPMGAEFLHLAVQNDIPTLWALVPQEPTSWCECSFLLAGTGHPVDLIVRHMHHVGTFFHGSFVWHMWYTGHYTRIKEQPDEPADGAKDPGENSISPESVQTLGHIFPEERRDRS